MTKHFADPGESSDFLYYLCWLFQNLMQNQQWGVIDEWFNIIDVEKTGTVALIGFLRYTYSCHDKLSSWEKFRDNTYIALRRRMNQEKVEEVMIGLLEPLDDKSQIINRDDRIIGAS